MTPRVNGLRRSILGEVRDLVSEVEFAVGTEQEPSIVQDVLTKVQGKIALLDDILATDELDNHWRSAVDEEEG